MSGACIRALCMLVHWLTWRGTCRY